MVNGHVKMDWYQKCEKYHKENYASWWNKMAEEWNGGEYDDCVWMAGSSSYIVRLGGVMFAVDPVWLLDGVFDQISSQLKEDLKKLDFVIFTHEHGDHFMPEQLYWIRELPIRWVVPECMREVFKKTGVKDENCIFLKPNSNARIKDIEIETFLGHHHYKDGDKGPESLMYLIKNPTKTLFFTGDVRGYKIVHVPENVDFDVVFYNMYVHRTDGYGYPFSDYYPDAVDFITSFNTKLVYVGHLYGFQCGHPDLIWNYMHLGVLADAMYCLKPDVEVVAPKVGKRYPL